jgi:hypothetical protein
MAGGKKTWREKLEQPGAVKVETLDKPFCGAPAGAEMLISTPRDVADYIRSLPPGATRSIAEVRRELAARYGAQISCPTSTSIFVRVVAEVALEDMAQGRPASEVTPFWRVVDPDGPLAARLTCDKELIRALRAVEA